MAIALFCKNRKKSPAFFLEAGRLRGCNLKNGIIYIAKSRGIVRPCKTQFLRLPRPNPIVGPPFFSVQSARKTLSSQRQNRVMICEKNIRKNEAIIGAGRKRRFAIRKEVKLFTHPNNPAILPLELPALQGTN